MFFIPSDLINFIKKKAFIFGNIPITSLKVFSCLGVGSFGIFPHNDKISQTVVMLS
jgi:hypothetical protein